MSITESILNQASQLHKSNAKHLWLIKWLSVACLSIKPKLAFKDLITRQILTYSMSYHANLEMDVGLLGLHHPYFCLWKFSYLLKNTNISKNRRKNTTQHDRVLPDLKV